MNEQEARQIFESTMEYVRLDGDSGNGWIRHWIRFDYGSIFDANGQGFPTAAAAWVAAAEWVQARRKEQEEIKEEIKWLFQRIAPAHATIPLRIRTRLQAALTEKQRGFKKEQL